MVIHNMYALQSQKYGTIMIKLKKVLISPSCSLLTMSISVASLKLKLEFHSTNF